MKEEVLLKSLLNNKVINKLKKSHHKDGFFYCNKALLILLINLGPSYINPV